MSLSQLIQARLHSALADLVPDPGPFASMIKQAQDPKLGDYQANCAMALSKALGRKSTEIAQEIAAKLVDGELIEKATVAGPGFINIGLNSSWLSARLQQNAQDERLGVEPAVHPRTYVIDFSSPNVALMNGASAAPLSAIADQAHSLLGHHVITSQSPGRLGNAVRHTPVRLQAFS